MMPALQGVLRREACVDRRENATSPDAASRWVFVKLLAFVLAVFAVTGPVFFYPGDNFVPRAECAHWLNTGEFGVPFARRQELGEFVLERGQYFYENESRQ